MKNEENPNSKLSNAQVLEARNRYKAGESIKKLYEDYKETGISLGGFRNAVQCANRKDLK